MVDKTQSDAAQAQIHGYDVEGPEIAAPSTNVPTEDKTKTTSVSSPPEVSTATKPSALADQSTTNSGVKSSPSPPPESRPMDTVTTQNAPRDPQVASLKAIFPDYDETILQTVLESVDRDQDRAVDLLLGMSDPEFKSEAPPAVQQPQMTQEELDEQLARRLMLEEQEHAQQWQQQNRPRRRSSRMQGQQQQQQQSPQQTSPPVGGKDTMTEFQEQFSKYAEIGKKNFGLFVSKVKEKIQEFDKPNTSGSGSGVQPTWGDSGGTPYYDSNAAGQPPPPRTNYQQYHGQHNASGMQSPFATTPANAAISQPAAFYDPNPSPQQMSPPTQFTSPTLSEKKQMQSSISVEGYEVEPMPSRTSVVPAAGSASASQSAQSTAAATSGGNPSASAPPRGPSPANPIDGGKLGLLPKRPISLIRDPPQNQPHAQRRTSDDDDLEYAENPFDEDRK